MSLFRDHEPGELLAHGRPAAAVGGSRRLGSWTFPTRADYERHMVELGVVQCADDVWADEQLTAQIHRHWHGRGQNGCQFAQLAAIQADMVGWDSVVVSRPARELEARVTALAGIPHCRSSKFPTCERWSG
jgi:hypothetical protein